MRNDGMVPGVSRRAGLVLCAFCLLCGCSPVYTYAPRGHRTFTASNVAVLRVGMSADEVRHLFGRPDEEYAMGFGADLGREWTGTVWVYFTKRDRSLRYVRRHKKNALVFYASDDGLKLNHWNLEP